MYHTYIYESKLPEVVSIPFSTEPFYAIAFLLILLILFVALARRKYHVVGYSNDNFIAFYDILNQPIKDYKNNHYPKEGVLFNNGSKWDFSIACSIHCFM